MKRKKLSQEEWRRFALHLPWGMLAAVPLWWWIAAALLSAELWLVILLASVGVIVSATALWAALKYEKFNEMGKEDQSYKDVLGIVWGWNIGTVPVGIVAVILLHLGIL